MNDSSTIMALDIGSARIGIALASGEAKIARPLGAIANDSSLVENLRELCSREHVNKLVIGLPRNLNGQETAQTVAARELGVRLAEQLDLPFHWQDEALTSVQAETELRTRGKAYTREDIDALAAVYILEDYLHVGI